jgi:hypothetical protein
MQSLSFGTASMFPANWPHRYGCCSPPAHEGHRRHATGCRLHHHNLGIPFARRPCDPLISGVYRPLQFGKRVFDRGCSDAWDSWREIGHTRIRNRLFPRRLGLSSRGCASNWAGVVLLVGCWAKCKGPLPIPVVAPPLASVASDCKEPQRAQKLHVDVGVGAERRIFRTDQHHPIDQSISSQP